MNKPFIIALTYKGIEREFEATLHILGYTHRFQVLAENTEVIFERDEEGNYRAIVPPELTTRPPETALLQAIATAIEQILA